MSAAAVFTAGSTALITGAASGIGLAVAKLCASKGMKVFLVDNKSDALEAAKSEVSSAGASDVATAQADVSQLDSWAALKDKAVATFGSVELLVLNAGIGLRGQWGDNDYFQKVCTR